MVLPIHLHIPDSVLAGSPDPKTLYPTEDSTTHMSPTPTPRLSVIVVGFRMQRELPRTLFSLSTEFQREVTADDYEVIVVENASDQCIDPDLVSSFGRQFHYILNEERSVSPAGAINLGVRSSQSPYVMINVDGARILSPCMLRHTLDMLQLYQDPIVTSLSWHLGPDNQVRSVKRGYSQAVEDALLAQADWTRDGYSLFKISVLAGSSRHGWFRPANESNCLSMRRSTFDELSGFDEGFQCSGGGFVNLDFFRRAVLRPQSQVVVLLGEGTFHQVHGGAATGRTSDSCIQEFHNEYIRLRGMPFSTPQYRPTYFGQLPEECEAHLVASLQHAGTATQRLGRIPGLSLVKKTLAAVKEAGSRRAA